MKIREERHVRIVPLNQHPEHVETVVGWIFDQWGTLSREETKDMLVANKGGPPALIAMSPEGPVGVLGYKFHLLKPAGSEELWINALLITPTWRGRGIGRRLLIDGMKAAVDSGRNSLYVYTDIPAFYENVGWRRFRYNDETQMHVLEYRPSISTGDATRRN